jgi:hypothetical protein
MISIKEYSDVASRDNSGTQAPSVATQTQDNCHHYWLIDRANGPSSHAVCKYCHEERSFSNLPPQYSPENAGAEPSRRRDIKKLSFGMQKIKRDDPVAGATEGIKTEHLEFQ